MDRPAELLAIADSNSVHLDDYWADRCYPKATTGGENGRFQCQKKHMGMINVAFADGHAKSVKVSSLQWGPAFYGIYSGTIKGYAWNTPVADSAVEQQEW